MGWLYQLLLVTPQSCRVLCCAAIEDKLEVGKKERGGREEGTGSGEGEEERREGLFAGWRLREGAAVLTDWWLQSLCFGISNCLSITTREWAAIDVVCSVGLYCSA